MATSNRDRIGKMFDLLSPNLEAFIHRAVGSDLPAGNTWVDLVRLRDTDKGITGKEYAAEDPYLQLRFITQGIPNQVKRGWWPFSKLLSRVEESHASELLGVRNDWAHGKSFTDDDAYRALDTAERFTRAIGAPKAADEIRDLRLSLRRVTAEKDDRRTIRSSVISPEVSGRRPWREVLPPHEDVATGNFQAAQFAADLYQVATNTEANAAYADPVEFFSRTYLTEGLQDLVGRAVRRLTGDQNASPVVNLQTNFGGGKTHSMLALWHLAAGRPATDYTQDVQELLASHGYDAIAGVRRVALVGQHLAVSGQVKEDGTRVNTLWGELAWQLGGLDAYEIVRASDEAGTAPGEALHRLLRRYAPALILIDEWVAYARQLISPETQAGGAFDTQFTFAQSLTEAAAAIPGLFLAISIPASHQSNASDAVVGNEEEVGGAHGQEALRRLQNVVRRVADQWRPASSNEAYHIVRQRLFVQPDAQALAEIRAVARQFGEMYRANPGDFPGDARGTEYEARIRQTYPIHPELFDRLYEDWSSLERFQRTRGVLRLLNVVIHALWVGGDASPLILPGSVPLATGDVNSELTQYLPDSWKAVIDADVDGPQSEPARIDAGRALFGQRSLTKRLARTVFLGSAPRLGSAQKGIETTRVFLGTAVPGDVTGNFHAALAALGDRATYFYSGAGKYWYDLQANITRRAKDHAERLHEEEVWAEIRRLLAGQSGRRGDFAGVHVCPEENADIPDTDEARLVILHPRYVHKRDDQDSTARVFARQAAERRGSAARTYRNMVVFLAADSDRMSELNAAVREFLGWSEVADHATDLDLTENQKNQAIERRRQAGETAQSRLLNTYQWALLPTEREAGTGFRISERKVDGSADFLAERVTRRLGNDGELSTRQAAVNVRRQLDRVPQLWAAGHVSVADLWSAFASYPYLSRLRDQQVLAQGVTDHLVTWDRDGFALAEAWDSATERYVGLWLPDDAASAPVVTSSTLVVQPDRARAQREAERAAEEERRARDEQGDLRPEPSGKGGPDGGTDGTPSERGTASAGGTVTPPAEHPKTRFFGSRELRPDALGLDFKKVHEEVLAHLAQPGVELTVRIDVEATKNDGFDAGQVRTVSENARTLKFEQAGFEEA